MSGDCDPARYAPFPLRLAAGWLHFSTSDIRLLARCPSRPPFRAAADYPQPLSATPTTAAEGPPDRRPPANRHALVLIPELSPHRRSSPRVDFFRRSYRLRRDQRRMVPLIE